MLFLMAFFMLFLKAFDVVDEGEANKANCFSNFVFLSFVFYFTPVLIDEILYLPTQLRRHFYSNFY